MEFSTQLLDLPNDVLREIIKKMDRDSAINYCKTNKKMKTLCAEFWRQWAMKDFGVDINEIWRYDNDYHKYLAEAVKFNSKVATHFKIDEKRCAWEFQDKTKTCEKGSVEGQFFCTSHRRCAGANIQKQRCKDKQELYASYTNKATSMSLKLAKRLRSTRPKEFNLHLINVEVDWTECDILEYRDRLVSSEKHLLYDLVIALTLDLYEETEGYIFYKGLGFCDVAKFSSGNRQLFSHKLKMSYPFRKFAQEMGLTSEAVSYLYNADKFGSRTKLIVD
jgi:hypothetical protein